MFVVKITGGLGNQMFQYLLGRHISKKYNSNVFYDISSFKNQPEFLDKRKFELSCFDLPIAIVDGRSFEDFKNLNKIEKVLDILNAIFKKDSKSFLPINEFLIRLSPLIPKYIKNRYYLGYWQDTKYFSDLNMNLSKVFNLREELHDQLINHSHKKDIKAQNSVSLQVRRGDYLKVGDVICNEEFYKKSIEYINQKIKNPIFYVFSDDIDWCKKNLKYSEKFVFIEPNLSMPFEDMHLMSQCKHNIIVNSTYGWWGAMMNDNKEKIIISPRKWKNKLNLPNFIKI